VSRVEPVGDDPSALLASLGVRLSDVLSAERVLVVEGPSDEDVLEVWFPGVMRNPNVAVLSGGGGDNARYADRFADWLAGVDRIGLRRVLYLRDRDELSASALKRLEDSKTVNVLARRELENYLLDAPAVAAVLDAALPKSAERPSPEEVDAAIRDAAESLRRKIIIHRVCRQIAPSRPLMDHELRRQLARTGDGMEEITKAVLARLISAEDLRAQIAAAWQAAEIDVASQAGDAFLALAPGEEILDAVFIRFVGRHYKKRYDGVAIARAILSPPDEIRNIRKSFMTDEDDTWATH
jgi:hypothetical protein